MPVDPSIAMGFRGIQLENPLDQYNRFLQAKSAQQQNALAQKQMEQAEREVEATNALNRAYAEAYNPQTGDFDINKLRGSLSAGGYGSRLPDIEKKLGEVKTQRLTQQKSQTELVDAALKQSRAFLDTLDPNDPEAGEKYVRWHAANHADPVLGPVLAARGVTFESAMPAIERAKQEGPASLARLINMSKLGAEKFIEVYKPTTQVINRGGRQDIVQITPYGGAPTTIGTYADVPLPPDVLAQQVRRARAGAAQTTVKLPQQEAAFETELGKKQAAKIFEDQVVAQDARAIIDTVQQGRQLLKSGVITGFGAEALTQIGSALNQIGISFAEDSVANTQAFAANMAANVGRVIKQFGAGTGLSNADREYAEKMAGGKVTLTKDAIERILDINERAARNSIVSHNKRVKGVKTNIPLEVEEPPREIGAKDIPTGNRAATPTAPAAAPATPVYARNPTTGERIMSTDGGRTWAPAR